MKEKRPNGVTKNTMVQPQRRSRRFQKRNGKRKSERRGDWRLYITERRGDWRLYKMERRGDWRFYKTERRGEWRV
jgi:hypothetical protein